jgi:hypothetical protein
VAHEGANVQDWGSPVTRRERRERFVASLRARPAPGRIDAGTAINVHIQDLVLHRFPAHAARQVGDGVASELTHLFAVHGVPERMLGMHGGERVDAGVIAAASGPDGPGVGRDIARALYGCQPASPATSGHPKDGA